MARLLRVSIVLAASYSIALQVLLLGFAWASHAGSGELATICSSNGSSGNNNGSLPGRGGDCSFCQLACAAAPPIVLPAGANLSLLFVEQPQLFAWCFGMGPTRPRHQPQEARGPPLS